MKTFQDLERGSLVKARIPGTSLILVGTVDALPANMQDKIRIRFGYMSLLIPTADVLLSTEYFPEEVNGSLTPQDGQKRTVNVNGVDVVGTIRVTRRTLLTGELYFKADTKYTRVPGYVEASELGLPPVLVLVDLAISNTSFSSSATPGTVLAAITGKSLLGVVTIAPADMTGVYAVSSDGTQLLAGLNFPAQAPGALPPVRLREASLVALNSPHLTPPIAASKGRAVGLSYTPASVGAPWIRPATVAAGKIAGSIPSDAIVFETGNGGAPFSSFYTFMDACNAADKPGAIETPLTFGGLVRTYIKRGLYGAGAADVKIKWTGRTTGNKHCLLHAYRDDVIIRGIDWDSWGYVVGVTYPTLRLLESDGVTLNGRPYHAGDDPCFLSLASRPLGVSGAVANDPAANFSIVRLGQVTISGAVSISALNVRRQTPDTTQKNGSGIWDQSVQANRDTVYGAPIPLFTAQACTTAQQVVDAVNAGSGTHAYKAELGSNGEAIIMPVTPATPAFAELVPTYTGAGTVSTNVRTPGIDMQYCTLTDCNGGIGAVLDVPELGPILANKNKLYGTWSLVSGMVTRWSDVLANNVNWEDCLLTRATAVGRNNSRLPTGTGQTVWNTMVYMGTDNQVHMHYHEQGNRFEVDNGRMYNVQGGNSSDTVNCCVVVDVRSAWQRTDNARYVTMSYNDIFNVKGVAGADDCNIFYTKARGYTCEGNRCIDFGAEYFANTSTQNGSESGFMLSKNPSGYNALWNGVMAEPQIVRGNYLTGGPQGVPWIKQDELKCVGIVEFNLFRGWKNMKLSLSTWNNSGPETGLIRHPATQYGPKVRSNRFENCSTDPTQSWWIWNCWNMSPFPSSFVGPNFEFHSNEFINDGSVDFPAWTADAILANVQFGSGTPSPVATFMNGIKTGHNRLLAPDGSDTGFIARLWADDSNVAYSGDLATTYVPFSSGAYTAQSPALN